MLLWAGLFFCYVESIARIRRCPVTGYLQLALLPLVPGVCIYDAMRHCIVGKIDLFLSTLIHTFSSAVALAIGAMLTSAVIRSVSSVRAR